MLKAAQAPRPAALNTAMIEAAKPQSKPFRLNAGGSLFLIVRPSGAKSWEFRWKKGGRINATIIGTFPEIGLAKARQARDKIKAMLAEGRDPAADKAIAQHEQRERLEQAKQARRQSRAAAAAAALTVEAASRAWHSATCGTWTAVHSSQVLQSLEDHVFPRIGSRRLDSITAGDVLSLLDGMIAEGKLETAQRIRQRLDAILEWSALHFPDIIKGNPVSVTRRAFGARLRQARKTAPKQNFPCIAPSELPALLRGLRAYTGDAGRLCWFLAYTAARTGEARGATWDEFDLQKGEWRIAGARMKSRRDHVVYLSLQCLELLAQIRENARPGQSLLFVNPTDPTRPASENAVLYVLAQLGYRAKMTGHGFRSLLSTCANESGLFSADVIEAALAHVQGDRVRAAYNRAQHESERRRLAQWWSDELDRLERGETAKVVRLRQ